MGCGCTNTLLRHRARVDTKRQEDGTRVRTAEACKRGTRYQPVPLKETTTSPAYHRFRAGLQ